MRQNIGFASGIDSIYILQRTSRVINFNKFQQSSIRIKITGILYHFQIISIKLHHVLVFPLFCYEVLFVFLSTHEEHSQKWRAGNKVTKKKNEKQINAKRASLFDAFISNNYLICSFVFRNLNRPPFRLLYKLNFLCTFLVTLRTTWTVQGIQTSIYCWHHYIINPAAAYFITILTPDARLLWGCC